MSGSKQSMEGVKSGGRVRQRSNVETEQTMKQIEAVGDVEQLIQVATSNVEALAAELSALIPKLREYDPGATAELERLRLAEDAAKAGKGDGIVSALKGTARWVCDFATKVGASLVAHNFWRSN